MENYVLNNFDPTKYVNIITITMKAQPIFWISFESMKLLCEKYNRAVDNIRKLVQLLHKLLYNVINIDK